MDSIEEWVKEEQAKQSKSSHGQGKKNVETYIEDWNNWKSCENLITNDKCKDLNEETK